MHLMTVYVGVTTMTFCYVRFNLSNGGHQNKARCVAVASDNWEVAVQRVVMRYQERGRDVRPYAVQWEGSNVWFKLDANIRVTSRNPIGDPLRVIVYDLGPAISNPSEIEVEYPAWAA